MGAEHPVIHAPVCCVTHALKSMSSQSHHLLAKPCSGLTSMWKCGCDDWKPTLTSLFLLILDRSTLGFEGQVFGEKLKFWEDFLSNTFFLSKMEWFFTLSIQRAAYCHAVNLDIPFLHLIRSCGLFSWYLLCCLPVQNGKGMTANFNPEHPFIYLYCGKGLWFWQL